MNPTPRRRPFGDILRSLRSRAGYSQVELAQHAGVDRSYITQLENGQRSNVTVDKARALARALGVPLMVLLGEEPAGDGSTVISVDQAKAAPLTRLSDYTAEQLIRLERAARFLLAGEAPPADDDPDR